MGRKGAKSLKGKGETDWGEPKSAKLTINVTPTGKVKLLQLADRLFVSIAELLERLARGLPIEEKGEFDIKKLLRRLADGEWLSDCEIVEASHALDLDEEVLIALRNKTGRKNGDTSARPGSD